MLIGTDILSRGIDVEGIELVVNFDTPHDAEDYVHRIGRTARAERTGTAITFVNEKDYRKFLRVENLIGSEIQKLPLPEEFGPGPVFQSRSDRPKNNKPGKRKFHRRPGGKVNKRSGTGRS